MSKLYKKLVIELGNLPAGNSKEERNWVQKYLGSNKPTRCVKSGEIEKLAKKIVKEEDLSIEEFTDLIDSFYKNAKTFEETCLPAKIINVAPKLRKLIDPNKLDYWLNFTHGWAENDVLTQNNFGADEILANWEVWKKLLIDFSKDANVHKRRASLVLLVKSVRDSNDKRLPKLAFENVDKLKNEKDILITKAVSWILRSLIKNHKKEVADYLEENKGSLPKIAVREVENKLLTGKKYNKLKK